MADVYKSNDALIRDYNRLSDKYKNKAGRYIKALLQIQRAERGVIDNPYAHERPLASKAGAEIRCSFCGNVLDQVDRIIAGPMAYICDECIRVCDYILDETDWPTPTENDEQEADGAKTAEETKEQE